MTENERRRSIWYPYEPTSTRTYTSRFSWSSCDRPFPEKSLFFQDTRDPQEHDAKTVCQYLVPDSRNPWQKLLNKDPTLANKLLVEIILALETQLIINNNECLYNIRRQCRDCADQRILERNNLCDRRILQLISYDFEYLHPVHFHKNITAVFKP